MHLIPAIDLIEGKCVRLTQGDYAQMKVYDEDPLEVALRYQDAGLQRLHLVDLDGAKSGQIINYRVLERLANKTSLHIDFGGGLKSADDLRIAFECGARQVTIGTIAAKQRDLFLHWLRQYGSERIILGADARDGKIAVSGWQEASDLELLSFLHSYVEEGGRYTVCTDIAKDGMLAGPALDLYQSILAEIPDIKLIASGGVTTMEDCERLRESGCFAAIIGKAIYEGRITLKQMEAFAG